MRPSIEATAFLKHLKVAAALLFAFGLSSCGGGESSTQVTVDNQTKGTFFNSAEITTISVLTTSN